MTAPHMLRAIAEHIANNRANIEREAAMYAKSYGCSPETARRDVTDEYVRGYYEAAEQARYE